MTKSNRRTLVRFIRCKSIKRGKLLVRWQCYIGPQLIKMLLITCHTNWLTITHRETISPPEVLYHAWPKVAFNFRLS